MQDYHFAALLAAGAICGCGGGQPRGPGGTTLEEPTATASLVDSTGAIVLANRGLGPELPMQLVEERAPDGFDHLSDVITPAEILEVTDGYRKMAGFSLQQLHERPSLADMQY